MPCAFARIRTSFSCTSISKSVARASCQLPVGIGQLSVLSASCQWGPADQWSVPVPNVAFEADALFPLKTGNWQLSSPIPLATDNWH
jgi:hypothetical protein